MSEGPPRDLFDRRRRALRRARATGGEGDFIGSEIASQITERLGDVTRSFGKVAIIGARTPQLVETLRSGGAEVTVIEQSAPLAATSGATPGEEDRLPVEPGSFDLILWPGGLESVNDVPGALLRCRLALKPDGLMLGACLAEGSLAALRAVLRTAEAERPAARLHPQLALQAMGDLLGKTGLALPVVDVERLNVRYRSLSSLVRDLRAHAASAMLAGPVPALSRRAWQAAEREFLAAGGEEQLVILHWSGWAPDPSQPQPARRGSATASLAAALERRDQGGQSNK
jgi:hypothetical protein